MDTFYHAQLNAISKSLNNAPILQSLVTPRGVVFGAFRFALPIDPIERFAVKEAIAKVLGKTTDAITLSSSPSKTAFFLHQYVRRVDFLEDRIIVHTRHPRSRSLGG